MAKKATKSPVPVKVLKVSNKPTTRKSPLSPMKLIKLERRYKVLEMRRQGCQIYEIAEILGCTTTTVREDLKQVLSMAANDMLETVPEQRELELNRYNALLKRYQPLAEKGNLNAASLCLQISREIRKLGGVDAPEQKAPSDTGTRIYVGINVDNV